MPQPFLLRKRPSLATYGGGAVVFLLIVACVATLFFVFTGRFRRTQTEVGTTNTTSTTITASSTQVTRRLDGMPALPGEELLRPRAVMVDNQVDARPLFGLDVANIGIEAPVEGGITRFLLIFDAKTDLAQVGPIRSARPYFVDWAAGWQAAFFHVGGSPEALDQLKKSTNPIDINEMAKGWAFWRDENRVAPHQVMTSRERMDTVLADSASSTGWIGTWQFTDQTASSTKGPGDAIRIPYGGSYSVRWTYASTTNRYVRSVAGKGTVSPQNPVIADNVVVMKTDGKILDEKGRLKVRTVGSGDAVLYRDGKKLIIRWRRSPNEVLSFVGQDGEDVQLNPGKTWIQVTTDDQTFAGLGQ